MKIELEIPENTLKDMLLSAGGYSGYWAITDESFVHALKQGGVVTVRIRDDETGVPGPDLYKLTRRTLEKGLVLCATESPYVFGQLLQNNCDGPQADIIVQYALFGKVVYG